MPTMREFSVFLEKRCPILQVTDINLSNKSTTPATKSSFSKKQVCALANSLDSCLICKGTHRIYTCETYKKLKSKERADKIKSLKLCFNCLRPGHINSDCKWSGCKKCLMKHNTLLHYDIKHPIRDTARIMTRNQKTQVQTSTR